MKGNDHQCSLDPTEFTEMVKSIRILERALGTQTKTFQKCEEECFRKLGKSLVTSKRLIKGHVIHADDVCIKVGVEPSFAP